jgi:hypothetical protein
MPNDDPRLRASDDDRDRTASLLREHHAAGRLDAEEFQERLDATYEAKTLGALQELLADLPRIDLYQLPEQSMRRGQQATSSQPPAPAGRHGRLSAAWRHHWGSWVTVNMLLFVIWAISALSSNNMQGFWFLWVAGPWGAILLSQWLFGGHPPGGGHGQGQVQGGQPGELPAASLTEQKDPVDQAFTEREQRLDDRLQRHQDRIQDHVQRHQDRLQRHQDRMQRRQDRMRRPGQS